MKKEGVWGMQQSVAGQNVGLVEADSGAKKTYNTGDSLVVTDPTTSPALIGLSMGERTGSRVLKVLIYL
jgi:hypothetical protein